MARIQLICPECETPVKPAFIQPAPRWYECGYCKVRTPREELKAASSLAVVRGSGGPFVGADLTVGSIATNRVTLDQLIPTTTLTAVVNGTLPVLAGTYYTFRYSVLFRSDTQGSGIKCSLSLPVSLTRFASTAIAILSDDGAAVVWHDAFTADGDTITTVGVPTANADYLLMLDGILVPATGGFLALYAAASTAGATLTIRQGTGLVLTTL